MYLKKSKTVQCNIMFKTSVLQMSWVAHEVNVNWFWCSLIILIISNPIKTIRSSSIAPEKPRLLSEISKILASLTRTDMNIFCWILSHVLYLKCLKPSVRDFYSMHGWYTHNTYGFYTLTKIKLFTVLLINRYLSKITTTKYRLPIQLVELLIIFIFWDLASREQEGLV